MRLTLVLASAMSAVMPTFRATLARCCCGTASRKVKIEAEGLTEALAAEVVLLHLLHGRRLVAVAATVLAHVLALALALVFTAALALVGGLQLALEGGDLILTVLHLVEHLLHDVVVRWSSGR